MKSLILCACVLLATGFGAALVIATTPAVPAGGNPVVSTEQPDNIKNLQEKRIAVLKEVVEILDRNYRGGQFGFDQVVKARHDLLQAQLDATQTKEARIRLLEEMVKQAEALEEVVKKLFEAKQVTRVDALKASAFVLETKIALERAKTAKER